MQMLFQLNIPTPLKKYQFKTFSFLLKHDDLIHKDFSGNKARKIYYYLNNLPQNITTIVSFGSVLSNAMYSLSVFAKAKGLHFRYYAHHIPKKLIENPSGNLLYALENGMELIEGYNKIIIKENELFINEGIANKEAYFGIELLAKELIKQLKAQKYTVFLPSGTGTTALFLSKAFKMLQANNFEVVTTPCVANSAYLKEQFFELESNEIFHPKIIDTKKRYHFGRLYQEFYQIWLELQKETKVEFDLLYDPKGWLALMEHKLYEKNLVYIHQGGGLGNETMKKRYKVFLQKRSSNDNNFR